MRHVRQEPSVEVLDGDFKALGIIQSLGRQGISAIVVDGRTCSAWISRYITHCFSCEGSAENLERAHKPLYKETYA